MIKESKLIGTKVSMPYGWREFSPLDLFDFPMAKSLNKDDLIPKADGFPYVTRTVDNNGVNMLIDLSIVPDEYINPGNEFSFGLLGLEAFYQKRSYVAGQFVRRFVPNFDMNETLAMYFKTLIDKLKPELQTTSIKGYANILQQPLWMLPVTQDGQPDYGWMSSYIHEMENQRIRELDTYLQVTGLDDTTLTDNELQVLEQWRQHEKFGGTLLTKRFKVGDLFDCISIPQIPNYVDLQKGNIPYVTQTEVNNGVKQYIKPTDDLKLNVKKGIVLGVDTQVVYYQEKPFYANKMIQLIFKHNATKLHYLFVMSLLKAQFKKYNYNNKLSLSLLKDTELELPVTNDGTPDYAFMQMFIRAQEKLVMQRLDKFRQLQIDTTKAVI